MSEFQVHIDERTPGMVVRLRGDATVSQTTALRAALEPIVIRKPPQVILDLAELVFINSLGLGALLEFRRDLAQNGSRLRLAGASDQIADIFRKTRLVELFPMYKSADDAIDAS